MRRLVKFLRLEAADKRLVCASFAAIAAFWLGLRVLGYDFMRRFVRLSHAPSRVSPERVSWAVTTSAKLFPSRICLALALAGQYLLARAGHPSQIRVGVAPTANGRFTAHAWLICGERIVLGGAEQDLAAAYRVIADLPSGAS
jgi:hypothetical protein